MRIIFLGTPDFAVPSLEALKGKYDVVAAVTQPDRAGNRGAVVPCALKRKAEELGIPVLQYSKLRLQGAEELEALRPDIMVTCAYGQILDKRILSVAPHGVINVHASLLPKYRGSSPIQWAVLNGESVTGVTVMRTAEGLDCGDIILQESTPIGEEETSAELFERLSELGARLLIEALELIDGGKATFTPQDETQATRFPMLAKSTGEIDWRRGARDLKNHVRGMNPWPSAYTYFEGKLLKVWKASVVQDGSLEEFEPGEALATAKTLRVKCGDGALELVEVQPEGGKRMSAEAFAVGRRLVGKFKLGGEV